MEPVYPPQMTFWQAVQAGLIAPKDCPAYIEYLHTLPCVITRTRGPMVQVHHVVGHGLKATSGKTSDWLAFPLRYDHHLQGYPNGIHQLGQRVWEEKFGSQLTFSLQTLLQAIAAGKLVFRA